MAKKHKRIVTLLLIFVLAFSLVGCGKRSDGKPEKGNTQKEDTSEENSTEENTEGNNTENTFPLVEEKTTITYWVPMNATLTTIADSYSDNEFFKRLEEKTNIHIDFQHPAVGNEVSSFNLMIASGELTDMLYTGGAYVYPDGLDAAVDDGYFLDLTELLPQYAPNYLAALNNIASYDENWLRVSRTNKGRMVCVSQVMIRPQGPFAGLYVREDWLKDLGLETPVTYDDWEEMLTAFKEKKGATAPLMTGPKGYDDYTHALCAGYGVMNSFYQEDGVIKYGPVEEGWREFVTMMNRWYSNGLLDPDYMTAGYSLMPDQAMVTTGKTGAFSAIYTMIAAYEAANQDENATYIPVASPKKNANDTLELNMYAMYNTGIAISADSDKAELCLRMLNYLFSEEGFIDCNYGIEGDTFEYVDGKPVFTDKIIHNDTYTFAQAMALYTMPPANVCWQDWSRELAAVPEKDIVCYDIWEKGAGNKNMIPAVSALGMSVEDSQEYAKIMADVTSIVDEKTSQFISGAVSLDEYDAYLDSIKQMKIDRAIELIQDAYDAFMER